jgi:hypothetical protein
MGFRFIENYRDSYPVRLMCAVLEASPAGCYAWRERPCGSNFCALGRDPADPSRQRSTLWQSTVPCHFADAGTWRQPRPDRTADASIWHSGDHGAARRIRTTDSRPTLPIAPNLIASDFIAPLLTRSGCRYHLHSNRGGWLCLAAIMDFCSHRIVGWAMREGRTRLDRADNGDPPAARCRIDPSFRSRRAVRFT